jgi:two-component system response regulator FlrC|tara:strand:- start:1971 stop:3155 length:1185 start_codon:yes stop_codon:yes gene_type:complete
MSNFILDQSDEVFSNAVSLAFAKRGIEWTKLGDVSLNQAANQEKCLILSSTTDLCDTNSSKFETFLREHKITRALVFVAGAKKFEITSKLNGAIKFVHAPVALCQTTPSSEFFLSLFLEAVIGKYVNLPCGDTETADLVDLLCRLAGSNASVLINGPTGTGKEVVARLLHTKSVRKDEPFIAVNCAAIPENMLESMLFGHEKGAFTGAMQANSGLFRAAHSGTILLDEISEMPMALQSKLLRVLQEKVVTPVGSAKEITIDVRVLATTNRDMMEEIRLNNFREDLFYRLNVFPISTRSLAVRPLDIPAISAHLLTRTASATVVPKTLTAKALGRLMVHDWPGNVRELDNVIQRAEILSYSDIIDETNIIFDNELTFGPKNTMDALKSKLYAKVG